MKRESIIVGTLATITLGLGMGLLLLALLIYQSTDKGVLAQQTFIGKLQGPLVLLRMADRSLNMFYRGPKPTSELPRYDLELDPAGLATLEESLPRDVYILDDQKVQVKGAFTADGKIYPVKVRVRGDRYNHWAFRKKSWRLTFEDAQLFQGIKELNLIIPEDRVWFAEVLSAHRADKFGLFHPPMRFVTASINGSGPMLYLEVEHWTKEMLEKQAKPGDVNLYKTGGIATSHFNPGWDPINEDMGYWAKYERAVVPPHDSYEEVAQLFRLSRSGAHLHPRFKEEVDALFDHTKIIRWYAVSMLAGNNHVGGDNLRFFWDISRGRFEPIVWDISLTAPRPPEEHPGNGLWNEVLAVPEWRREAYQFLWQYLQDEASVNDDYAKAEELRRNIERAAYRDSLKLQSNRQVKADLDRTMRLIRENIDALRTELSERLATEESSQATENVQLPLAAPPVSS